MQFQMPILGLEFELVIPLKRHDDFVHVYGRKFELKIRFLEQTGVKNFFHIVLHSTVFFQNNLRKTGKCGFVAFFRPFFEVFRCEHDGCDRGFKLMGHIIDEIVLHFRQSLQTQNSPQTENSPQQYQ